MKFQDWWDAAKSVHKRKQAALIACVRKEGRLENPEMSIPHQKVREGPQSTSKKIEERE